MKIQSSREHAEIAKKEGKVVFCLGIDGRPANKSGMVRASGVCSPERANQILTLIREIFEEEQGKDAPPPPSDDEG